jgi:DNA-directed RNA polymerase specialized sigma24 family protein
MRAAHYRATPLENRSQNESTFSARADSDSREFRRMENPPIAKSNSETRDALLETYEAQAAECLRVGIAERGLLLALAVSLTKDAEEGEDLYQQKLLDCHDTIQRNGLAGSNYKFYIYQAIKWGHVAQQRAAGKLRPLETAPQFTQATAPGPAPINDPLADLAAEVEQRLDSSFPARWAAAFRLHAAGKSCREIGEQMTPPRHHGNIARKLLRMKEALREAFGPAWAAIEPAE